MKDSSVPLCIDLDGTLTTSDTLHESLIRLVRNSPGSIFLLAHWLSKGKARFKQEVSRRVSIDVPSLPFRPEVLEWIKSERATGRQLVLATAADRKIADEVALHLEIFDLIIASNGTENLSGEHKRRALVERFGEKGFDYAGNDACDETVWKSSRKAIVVGGGKILKRAQRVASVERSFPRSTPGPIEWMRAIRLHQWVKNMLIFLPALLAHAILEPRILGNSLAAFLAFGLCASSVYLANDLFDLISDRHHPRKQRRPFAAGVLSVQWGVIAAIVLLAASVMIAMQVNRNFCFVLVGYYLITWAYSLRLKRAALIDVMTLAGLYTIRIVAGAVATEISPSFWLLAFSVFIFLSLGFVKRYTELHDGIQNNKVAARGRGYRNSDLPLLLTLGTASGYCTVVVMALYINSLNSQTLYRNPEPLWFVCPLLLYWISRVWLLTTRGDMHDDPIVFALRDRNSMIVLSLLALIFAVAI